MGKQEKEQIILFESMEVVTFEPDFEKNKNSQEVVKRCSRKKK